MSITLKANPIVSSFSGGNTFSGTLSSSSASLYYWYSDEAESVKRTEGITQDTTLWSLDIPLLSNNDIVNVRAEEGSQLSNIVVLSATTGTSKEVVPSFQVNEFDDIALSVGLFRIIGEDNDSLRNRILDVYSHPGNSSLKGLIFGITRELGLPQLDPFFTLHVKYNPLTRTQYKLVDINFGRYSVSAQISDYLINDETIELDLQTDTFNTVEEIGSESVAKGIEIIIKNGPIIIPRSFYRKVGTSKIFLNTLAYPVDHSLPLTISYPYKKSFSYKNKTVNDVKTWLTNLDSVVDENGVTVPLLSFNNGYFKEVSIPSGEPYEYRPFMEKMLDYPPVSAKYVKVQDNLELEEYEYVNNFASKSKFDAQAIIPTGLVELTSTPTLFIGSWLNLNALSNSDYQDNLLYVDGKFVPENLDHYARITRAVTHMGIRKTLIDKDYWDSDSPAVIGKNVVPSLLDKGLQDHTLRSPSGHLQKISLNKRRLYTTKMKKYSLTP